MEMLVFGVVVAAMIWLDLKWHNHGRSITLRDAAIWSIVWVLVSLAFAAYLHVAEGPAQAGLFVAGYLLEKSLSVDNLFVIAAIFTSFGLKSGTQHRVLYYGILGAIVFRLLFVSLGSAFLIAGRIHPVVNTIVYTGFGLLVLGSAVVMIRNADNSEEEPNYTEHWSVRLFRDTLHLPVTHRVEHDRFFLKDAGKWLATPMFLCLLVVETSDIAFAFDSVPAVIAITKDLFLVYTSNIFAILGLRSMYFLLVAAKTHLCHLEKAIIGILLFIALKMFIEAFHKPLSELLGFVVEVPAALSLSVVVGGLLAGVVASYLYPEEKGKP